MGFFAASQVQELDNWDFSPKLALLCSAWPTCLCLWGATGVSAPLVLLFQESGFCAPWYHSALKLSWHALGIWVQKLVFLCLSSTQGHWCFSWSMAKLSCCSTEGQNQPGALGAQTGPALLAVTERRWILQRIQATYWRAGSFGRRAVVWRVVSRQRATGADGLAVLAAESPRLSWHRGEQSPHCSCPNASPSWSYPGQSRHRAVCRGHGVFHSRDETPTFCPGLHHWGQGSFSPSSPLGTAATILCPPETHLEGNSIAITFLTTSARWFPVRSESWDKGIKTSSSRLQKLSQGLSPGKALMLITLRGSFPHTGMHCEMIDTSLINCY